jgi:hypothetical protein
MFPNLLGRVIFPGLKNLMSSIAASSEAKRRHYLLHQLVGLLVWARVVDGQVVVVR